MDPCTAAALSLMERIGRDGGAPDTGGPYDQHGLLLRPRYRYISSIACPGMPRVSAPHFEAVLGQLLPHRGAWVHLSSTFEAGAPGAPPVLGFVFWDCEGDRWVRFAAIPWSAPDRSSLCHRGTAGTWQTLPEASPDHDPLHCVSPIGLGGGHLSPSPDGRAVSSMRRWNHTKTPKTTATLTLYLFGLFVAFVARPPVTITDQMQTRYLEMMDTADAVDAAPRAEAERLLADVSMARYRAETCGWRFNS